MKKCIFFLFLIFLSDSIFAQTDFLKSINAYLGQKPPGEKPEIFAKGMLIDSGFAIGRVAFSNDGREFFYSFASQWFNDKGSGTNRIVFDGKQWSKPALIANELTVPTLSIDGKSLFLLGAGGIIWKLDKKSIGWGTPYKYFDLPFGLYNLMPTQSGCYYVGSNGNWGKKDDFNTYKFASLSITDKDTIIKSLGSPLNKPGFNGDFYIAPDESYIIISTNETPDYESELYISFRNKDNTWKTPISLGDEINRGKAHRFGQYVSPDGRYLFYTCGTSEKDTHIYWLRFDGILSKLRILANRDIAKSILPN